MIAFIFIRRKIDNVYGVCKVPETVLPTFMYIASFNSLNFMRKYYGPDYQTTEIKTLNLDFQTGNQQRQTMNTRLL